MLFVVEGIGFGYITYRLSRGMEKFFVYSFTLIFMLALFLDPLLYQCGIFFAPHNYLLSLIANMFCYGCALIGIKFRL